MEKKRILFRRALLLSAMAFLLVMPAVFAAEWGLGRGFEEFSRILRNPYIVYGAAFIFISLLLYGIFGAALRRLMLFRSPVEGWLAPAFSRAKPTAPLATCTT